MAGIVSHSTGRSIFGSKNHYDSYYTNNSKQDDDNEKEYMTYEEAVNDDEQSNSKYKSYKSSQRQQSSYDYIVDDALCEDEVEIDEYADDPILGFLTADNVTKDSFALVVRSLPVSDKPLIKYMNKAFHVFEELMALSKRISSDWEFVSMEAEIQKAILLDHEESKSLDKNEQKLFNTSVANTVMEKSLDFNQKFYELSTISSEVNRIVATFSPLQAVSDPGMVLSTLSLKVIDLKAKVNQQINIVYAQAKLILMGADLDDLLYDFNLDKHADNDKNANGIIDMNHPIISNDLATTIEGYKDFVITILNQLHDARQQEDDDEISEVLAVIGDLEKMFEALMKQVYEPEVKSTKLESKQPSQYENNDTVDAEICVEDEIPVESGDEMEEQNENISNTTIHPHNSSSANTFDNDTLYESDYENTKPKEKMVGTHNNIFGNLAGNFKSTNPHDVHTNLTDELPYLLKAFENAKEAENEIRDTLKKSGISNISSSPVKEKKPSNDHLLSYSDSNSLVSPTNSSFNINNNQTDSYLSNSLYSQSFFSASPTSSRFDSSHPLIINKESVTKNPETGNTTESLTSSLFGSFGIFKKPSLPLTLPDSTSQKSATSQNESSLRVVPKSKINGSLIVPARKDLSMLDNDID